jgi:hypothetical protein
LLIVSADGSWSKCQSMQFRLNKRLFKNQRKNPEIIPVHVFPSIEFILIYTIYDEVVLFDSTDGTPESNGAEFVL